jgi:hypothetical protein
MPHVLRPTDQGAKKIGVVRVLLAAASALVGLLGDVYKDEGVTFPFDAPVSAGTTDYGQFILGAQDAGVVGVILSLGEQEAVQVVNAAKQLDTNLKLGTALE